MLPHKSCVIAVIFFFCTRIEYNTFINACVISFIIDSNLLFFLSLASPLYLLIFLHPKKKGFKPKNATRNPFKIKGFSVYSPMLSS